MEEGCIIFEVSSTFGTEVEGKSDEICRER